MTKMQGLPFSSSYFYCWGDSPLNVLLGMISQESFLCDLGFLSPTLLELEGDLRCHLPLWMVGEGLWPSPSSVSDAHFLFVSVLGFHQILQLQKGFCGF